MNAYIFNEDNVVVNVIVLDENEDASLWGAQRYPKLLGVGFKVTEDNRIFDSYGEELYTKEIEDKIREERDELLKITDWVVTKSVETGEPIPQAWLNYRQALRDITTQAGFPSFVDFPMAP